MAQRIYATASDYYDFIGEDQPMTTPEEPAEGEEAAEPAAVVEADLNATLRRASIVIDGLTRNSVYDVDEDGYATDEDITTAFTDATCAQAAWFEDTEDVSGAGSQEGTVSIGSVSIGARGRTSGNGAPSAQASRIAPEAIDILRTAGLFASAVSHT